MKSWLTESGPEKCRCFRINWEMESSNPGSSSEVGTKSRQGVDLRKRQWAGCRSQLCLQETLGELLPTFRPSVEWESGIQWSPRPLPSLASWEACIPIPYPGREGVMIPWSWGDYRSLVRSDSCSPSLPYLVLSHTGLLAFPLICPSSSHLRALAGSYHPGYSSHSLPLASNLIVSRKTFLPPDGVGVPQPTVLLNCMKQLQAECV